MKLIWAIGQTFGNYIHKPASGLEKGKASVPDFYRPDEVKYHGKNNRGHTMVNFFDKPVESSERSSEFKIPNNCVDDCDYVVKWSVLDDILEVIVSSKAEADEWIGVGFSYNSIMVKIVFNLVTSNMFKHAMLKVF